MKNCVIVLACAVALGAHGGVDFNAGVDWGFRVAKMAMQLALSQ